MRNYHPIRLFVLTFLPGASSALLLGLLATASAPSLAPVVLLSFGFLAFALAVGFAAKPPRPRRDGSGRAGPVLALLELRRNRCRYAFVFAAAAAGFAALALRLALVLGIEVPFVVNTGHVLLTLAVLFVSAWIQIGEAACSTGAVRRAFLGHRGEE
ncbi:hypothetical protein [Defluviimonas sp. SAOS-178_SWC]|uniref:hypothetical protein n=1 Tax=Defluviimonas sp. SAOS-178_SWC TaxID=3121287 RepID=UPI003221B90F